MPQDHEFRCFVSNRTLHAISQYHCYTKFPALQDSAHVLQIRDTITKFHDAVKNGFPMADYVLDVVVFPDMSCHVIEVNPFGPHMSSGAGLFNWEKDGELMCGITKRDVPAIRVLKQLIEN